MGHARVLLLALVLTACASGGGAGSGAGLTGTFDGDPVLEGGCAWLDVGDTRYELALPDGYEVDVAGGLLIGPGGEPVARFGEELTVTGRVADDRVSFCQVGPLFDVETVQAGG